MLAVGHWEGKKSYQVVAALEEQTCPQLVVTKYTRLHCVEANLSDCTLWLTVAEESNDFELLQLHEIRGCYKLVLPAR